MNMIFSFIKRAFVLAYGKTKLSFDRLKNSDGFTLTEVLATVIILGFVTSLVATAVTVGTQQFARSMAASESRMLLSSLQQDLKNDLTYTTTAFRGDRSDGGWEDITGYYSSHHGYKKERLYIKALDSNGGIENASEGAVTGYGQLALCTRDGKIKNRLLGKAAYNYGLTACVKELKYSDSEKLYKVTLSISDGNAGTSSVEETFTIKSLANKVGNI